MKQYLQNTSAGAPVTTDAAVVRRLTVDGAAFACLCALVFAIPWSEQLPLLAGFVISRWLGLLAVGAALMRLIVVRRIRMPSPLHFVPAVFVAWNALSLLWSIAPDRTIVRLGTYAQLLLMLWMIWELAATSQRLNQLLYSYCFGTYISATSTIRNAILGIDPTLNSGVGRRYGAAGFDQNELGLLLVLSIPMSLYLLTRRRSRVLASLCWLQLIACIVAILLTGSRGACLSLIAASTMFISVFPFLSKRQKGASALVIVVLAVSSVYLIPAATWERIFTIPSELAGGTLSHRTSIWMAGLSVFREQPLFGVGGGAFGPAIISRLDIDYVAHNTYLSVLVELGVIGALVCAALLAGTVYSIMRMPRLQRGLWMALFLAWGVGVAALTWEYSKPTWLLFGLFTAHVRSLRDGFPRPGRRLALRAELAAATAAAGRA